MFAIYYLKKMAAAFLTDKNSNKRQVVGSETCNSGRFKNRNCKEIVHGSIRKKVSGNRRKIQKNNKKKKKKHAADRKLLKHRLYSAMINGGSVETTSSLKEHSSLTNNVRTNSRKVPLVVVEENVENDNSKYKKTRKQFCCMNKNDCLQYQGNNRLTAKKSSPSNILGAGTDVSALISSMAQNFKMVDTFSHDSIPPLYTPSESFQSSCPSTSPPLLSPTVTPKSSVSCRGSSRTSRSSTLSSFKENISSNCPSSPSTPSTKMSKDRLTQANTHMNRSPLNDKQINFQSRNLSSVFALTKEHHISKMHLKTNHAEKNEGPRQELKFIKGKKCVKCGYTSVKKSDLLRHVRCVHFKIRDFSCHICTYKCFGSSSLGQHIKSVHLKIKDHACKICGYRASRRADINKHMRYRHKMGVDRIKENVDKLDCPQDRNSGTKSAKKSFFEAQDVSNYNFAPNKQRAIHASKSQSSPATLKEPRLIQSRKLSCATVKTNNSSSRRIKSTRSTKVLNDESRSSINDGILMKAPKLENPNELPKLLRRSLRSLSPPKLIAETSSSTVTVKQNIVDKGVKLDPPEGDNVVDQIKPTGDAIESKNRSPYRQTFRDEWLQDPELYSWIQKYPPDPTKAFCPVCKITIGAKHSSLITHSKSGGHDKCLKEQKAGHLSKLLGQSLTSYFEEMPLLSHEDTNCADNKFLADTFTSKQNSTSTVHPADSPKRSPYRQIFRDEWLSDAELIPWLQKHNKDPTKAFCPICNISLMAKHSTLISHSKSGGHLTNYKVKSTKIGKTSSISEDLSQNSSNNYSVSRQRDNTQNSTSKIGSTKVLKDLTSTVNTQPAIRSNITNTQISSGKNHRLGEQWKTSPPKKQIKKKWGIARKHCPHCNQEQSQSNLARHIQQYCLMNQVTNQATLKQPKLPEKQNLENNEQYSEYFKHPLPKQSPLKASIRHYKTKNRRQATKVSKIIHSINNVPSLKNLKPARISACKGNLNFDQKRSYRSPSISSSCSSSNNSVKSGKRGNNGKAPKTANQLNLHHGRKEKRSLHPIRKVLESPLVCHLCNFTLGAADGTITNNEIRSKLIAHFELDHMSKTEKCPLDFNCDYCPYKTPLQIMLQSHIIVQHADKHGKIDYLI